MSKTQKPRIQVLMNDEKEVQIAHRNASIYAVANGLDGSSTTEAVRHMLLNLDPIAMLSKQVGEKSRKGHRRTIEVELPDDIYRIVVDNPTEIISASVRETYAMQGVSA
jgi:hypothetical protein